MDNLGDDAAAMAVAAWLREYLRDEADPTRAADILERAQWLISGPFWRNETRGPAPLTEKNDNEPGPRPRGWWRPRT